MNVHTITDIHQSFPLGVLSLFLARLQLLALGFIEQGPQPTLTANEKRGGAGLFSYFSPLPFHLRLFKVSLSVSNYTHALINRQAVFITDNLCCLCLPPPLSITLSLHFKQTSSLRERCTFR